MYEVERKELTGEDVQTFIKTSDLINLQPVRCRRWAGGIGGWWKERL